MKNKIQIPRDAYQSENELLIIIPLWWVAKDSIKIKISENTLHIFWYRKNIKIWENFGVLEKNCYRWDIQTNIDLPDGLYFENIKSTLSPENILTIIIPKIIEPDDIYINIE